MKSASQHSFARVPSVNIPRSAFKRNMTYKTTLNAGYLVPIFVDEVIPGDTWRFNLTSFARILSPLKWPILDNLKMDFHFFFCPIRLVYDDYEKFFGSSKGQAGNWQYDDSHVMPGITAPSGGFAVGSIFDYYGIPTGVAGLKFNALPFRCYNKIINDWFLPSVYEMTGPVIKTDNTDDSYSDYALVKRIKRADYFTSALISPQRGAGASISLTGDAPVVPDGAFGLANSSTAARASYLYGSTSNGANVNVAASTLGVAPAVGSNLGGAPSDLTTTTGKALQYFSGLKVDLQSVTAVTINSLRQAFQLQKALERDMRGGVQYVSQLLSHYGVRSPDARLQRSEFLGGGSAPINVHSVANTVGDSGGAPQGSLSAYGVSASNGIGFIKSFTEHGYILGFCSVRADLTYQQGLPRMFDRWQRFDFYYPVFSCIGEQAILNKEIFAQGPSVTDANGNVVDDLPFGYQERYGEYRFGVSKITGQLRSTYAQTLDAWHLAQKFNNLPTLNSQFLEEDVPMSRVKAEALAPDFLFDALFSINCVRPMPLFGVPGLVDHF